MSKLARKFLVSLFTILLVVTLLSLYLNSNFIQRLFLYQEKRDLSRVSEELIAGYSEETVIRLEAENDVIIVELENTDDNSLLNERLRTAFLQKGVSLGGYGSIWLWEEDQRLASPQEQRQRIYQHEKLHYSLMVQYIGMENSFIAIAKIIPAMQSTITLINVVTACVFSSAALFMLLFISFLVKKITVPLTAISETAKSISALDFKTVEIKTGDELEILAEDINDMSGKLQAAHQELESKNREMEALLTNVSHDLKTPISLIKAYTGGIKDGLDDGSFLDIIILQNEKMERMIERLLSLTKMQHEQTLSIGSVDFSLLLRNTLSEHQLQAESRGLFFHCTADITTIRDANEESVQTIFTNLISNAVKYAEKGVISVILKNQGKACVFEIQNTVKPETKIEPERLWEPFYVVEESRNKKMSGTGLGLPIVRAAAQKCGYSCSCELSDGKIRFMVGF